MNYFKRLIPGAIYREEVRKQEERGYRSDLDGPRCAPRLNAILMEAFSYLPVALGAGGAGIFLNKFDDPTKALAAGIGGLAVYGLMRVLPYLTVDLENRRNQNNDNKTVSK